MLLRGFNEENYESFITSDSTYKIDIGGKGIGRFVWLKAFERVDISSVFLEDGKKWKRNFIFKLPEEILGGKKNQSNERIYTSVKLINFKEKYRIKDKAFCDLNKKIEDKLKDRSFIKLPLGLGYFQYNSGRNVFMEVRTYDQIFSDVLGRHKTFFNKLGL